VRIKIHFLRNTTGEPKTKLLVWHNADKQISVKVGLKEHYAITITSNFYAYAMSILVLAVSSKSISRQGPCKNYFQYACMSFSIVAFSDGF
jgi:hypothetical protein